MARESDRPYIRWLHGQPCACHPCAAAPRFIQAHHPRGGAPSGRPGMSQRSPDRDAFAICDKHHAQITDFPTDGFFAGWTKEELRRWEQEQGFPEVDRVAADIAGIHGLSPHAQNDVERALRAFQKGRV